MIRCRTKWSSCETSFGAEVVPEGQRPVNEYLDLLRAPLFGWASEEVGTKGFITRISTFYAVIFQYLGPRSPEMVLNYKSLPQAILVQ